MSLSCSPSGFTMWLKKKCGFYDRNNCILGERNVPLGIWRGCDQVQIVYVLYWNLNIAAVFRACRQFQYPLISFNVKSEENTINLVNRTKKRLLCELERFLVTTGMRRYVLNETKSFFSIACGNYLFVVLFTRQAPCWVIWFTFVKGLVMP